jgi:serine/threonine-protein kinase
MNPSETIQFLRTKDYKFIKQIGQGGTGKTILIEDEAIDETFVCKKYSTFYKEDQSLYYNYFIDEIKILYTLYHENVVRVFNYYLYPENKTGYILMEYIEGNTIEDYLLENPDKLENIFEQLVDGFKYLEEKKILHRDLRPENILVSKEGILKIIDFGFGKKINFGDKNKSISLNWRYSIPDEFEESKYDFKTEIYFVGKLFEDLIQNTPNNSFKYSAILSKMILKSYENRINSFFDIYREIISLNSANSEITSLDRLTYQRFAESLMDVFSQLPQGAKYNNDIEVIIRHLDELYKNSILEQYIQNNNKLTNIFIAGPYKYYSKKNIRIEVLYKMILLLKASSDGKRKIILNNLWERFDSIPRYYEESDDLPF